MEIKGVTGVQCDNKIKRYGVTLPCKDLTGIHNKEAVTEFFRFANKQLQRGFRVSYMGISGEARGYVWNYKPLVKEIIKFLQLGGEFKHIFGPILSVVTEEEIAGNSSLADTLKGHIFDFILNGNYESLLKNFHLYVAPVREYNHDMLFEVRNSETKELENFIISFEDFHSIVSSQSPESPRRKFIFTYDKKCPDRPQCNCLSPLPGKYDNKDYKLYLLSELKRSIENKQFFYKEIKKTSDILTLKNEDIDVLDRLFDDDFQYIVEDQIKSCLEDPKCDVNIEKVISDKLAFNEIVEAVG